MARCVIWHDASRSQWQEYAHLFPLAPKVWDIGIQKGLHGSEDLSTKCGCDRSVVVGCRLRNDRQTSRQTDKQNGMTIRLTLCERDTIDFYLKYRFV